MQTELFLSIFQAVLSIILIILVLMQEQDSGFMRSSATMHHTRRGGEKLVYRATILVGILFVALSIVNFLK